MEFVLEQRRYADAEVAPLIAAVQQEYLRLYGGYDTDEMDGDGFDPPAGLFLLGRLDGVAVATGGYRAVEAGVVEIKRMYIAEGARGHGLGRRVLAALESSAAAAGRQRIVLNTGYLQHAAIALYESSGYARIAGYGHYRNQTGAFFYGKSLAADRPGEYAGGAAFTGGGESAG